MKITILYSLPTDRLQDSSFRITDEDTASTAEVFATVLAKGGLDVSLFPLSGKRVEELRHIHADCIVNLVDWTGTDLAYAEQTYAILDSMHLPYTGSNWNGYVTSSEKLPMKAKFKELGTPMPSSFTIPLGVKDKKLILKQKTVPFPLIVKLADDHCSMGLDRKSVVYDDEGLVMQVDKLMREFEQDILVEAFIPGREFQFTMLEREGNLIALPLTEIVFTHPRELNFLTFTSKWDESDKDYGLSRMEIADHVPNTITPIIETEARKIFIAFGFHDYARFDIRVNDKEVFFLEANANPGFDDSLECGVTLAAHAANISFERLLQEIITSAMYRYQKTSETAVNLPESASVFV